MQRTISTKSVQDVTYALCISLLIANACGILLFFRGSTHRGVVLDIVFGLSAAVFLGSFLALLLRQAAETLDAEIRLLEHRDRRRQPPE